MAPELRKRKPVEAVKPAVAAPKPAPKAASKTKRKATEDASPVTSKKQKSTKKTAVEKKPAAPKKAAAAAAKKETKSKTKSKTAKQQKQDQDMVDEEEEEEEEEEAKEEAAAAAEEQHEEADETADDQQLQVLAVGLDPEDEEAPDEAAAYKPGQEVGKIPKVSKEVERAAQAKAQAGAGAGSGVIYVGRIPHGFYEKQMRQYLTQFGPILRLRLSRNKKTGASKHFAFVEFAEASTAEIVAKTMDNYLLFGHILKCKQVAKEQLHDDVWKGANRRFKKVPWSKMVGKQLEKPLTESAWAGRLAREASSRAKKAAKLREMGYEFDAPKLKDAPAPAPAAIENGDGDGQPAAIEAASEPQEVAETKAAEPEPVAAEEPKASKVAKALTKAKATKPTRPKKAKA